MAKPATQKLSERQIEAANDRYLGKEPQNTSIRSTVDFIRALSWYSTRRSIDDAKQYLLDYVTKFYPDKVAAAKQVDLNKMKWSYGWIARMVMQNVELDHTEVDKLNRYIGTLTYTKPVRQKANNVISLASIRNREREEEVVGTCEEAVDNFDPNFDCYKHLQESTVSQALANRISRMYTAVAEEYVAAVKKTDPQIVEAYKNCKKSDLVARIAYLMRIIDDCQKYVGNKISTRKPKKVRQKKPEQILKHFVCKERDDDLKIVSINPAQILGASQLFVFNTSNNILTVYNAKDDKGLTVSRTSIANYDEKTSKSKRVGKKVQLVLDTIASGGKKQRSNVLDLVNTEFVTCSDRINTSHVILKAVK